MYIEPPRKLLTRFAVPQVAKIGCTLAVTAREATAANAILGMIRIVLLSLREMSECPSPRELTSAGGVTPRRGTVAGPGACSGSQRGLQAVVQYGPPGHGPQVP